MTNVFVSSTYLDLVDERTSLIAALQPHYDLRNMENFGSTGLEPIETCLAALNECEAMVLVLGDHYGSVITNLDMSYTEAEYEHAQARACPVFAYIRADFDARVAASAQSEDHKRKLRGFRATVESEVTVDRAYFTSPGDLATKALRDLQRWQEKASSRPAFGRPLFDIKDKRAYASEIVRRAESTLLAPRIVLVNLSAVNLANTPPPRSSRLASKTLLIEQELREEGLDVVVFTDLEAPTDADTPLAQRLHRLRQAGDVVVVFFAKDADDIAIFEEFTGENMTRFVWYRDTPPTGGLDVVAARAWTGDDLGSCQLAVMVERTVMNHSSQLVAARLGATP
jgi:hypothetical protein